MEPFFLINHLGRVGEQRGWRWAVTSECQEAEPSLRDDEREMSRGLCGMAYIFCSSGCHRQLLDPKQVLVNSSTIQGLWR